MSVIAVCVVTDATPRGASCRCVLFARAGEREREGEGGDGGGEWDWGWRWLLSTNRGQWVGCITAPRQLLEGDVVKRRQHYCVEDDDGDGDGSVDQPWGAILAKDLIHEAAAASSPSIQSLCTDQYLNGLGLLTAPGSQADERATLFAFVLMSLSSQRRRELDRWRGGCCQLTVAGEKACACQEAHVPDLTLNWIQDGATPALMGFLVCLARWLAVLCWKLDLGWGLWRRWHDVQLGSGIACARRSAWGCTGTHNKGF